MGIYSKSGQTGSSIPTFRFETLIEIQTLSQGGGAINYFGATMESWWPGAESNQGRGCLIHYKYSLHMTRMLWWHFMIHLH